MVDVRENTRKTVYLFRIKFQHQSWFNEVNIQKRK